MPTVALETGSKAIRPGFAAGIAPVRNILDL